MSRAEACLWMAAVGLNFREGVADDEWWFFEEWYLSLREEVELEG